MVDVRGFNGGMNTDSSPELLPSGDYTYAMNITNGSEGITNLPGNTLLQGAPPPTNGSEWVCGAHFDKTRQRIIYFTFNTLQYHRIIVVDVITEVHTVLFEDRADTGGSTIFNWGTDSQYNPNKIIKDIKIVYRDGVGDLVYFVDPLKRPLKFNTSTLPTLSSTNDVLFDYFKVIKAPPDNSIVATYIDVPNRNINNLRKKLFQFKYRFVYDDDEKSVWSAISPLPIPPRANDNNYYADGTKANGLSLPLRTGTKLVKKIEIAGRVNIGNNWGDFFLIDTLNKVTENISNDTVYTFTFLNDGNYIPIDIEESNLLFDYVPDEANALELANGNTLVFGGIKEGLPRHNVNQITISSVELNSYGNLQFGVAVGGLITGNTQGNPAYYYNQSVLDFKTTNYRLEVILDGNVSPGDVITLTFQLADTSTIPYTAIPASVSYTVLAGNTVLNVRQGLAAAINSTLSAYMSAVTIGPFGTSTLIIDTVGGDIAFFQEVWYGTVIIPIPGIPGASVYSDNGSGVDITYTNSGNTSLGVQVSSSLKWKGRYKYGIVYYTKDGKTNGVHTNKNMVFDVPEYKEVNGVPAIFYPSLDLSLLAPSWASYYHIVRTKELTSSFSKFFLTRGVDLTQIVAGPPRSGQVRINIQNIADHGARNPASAGVINYSETSFVKGDRIRFIKSVNTSNPASSQVFVNQKDYEIVGVQSISNILYAIIDYVDGMPDFTINNGRFLVEIFRPAPVTVEEEDNVFYEVTRTFTIQRGFRFIFSFTPDPNGNPYHEFINVGGLLLNTVDLTGDGDYYLKERRLVVFNNNTQQDYITYTCMDENYEDTWDSAVWNQGRPLVIDETARTQYFPALLRFSNSYLQGSNINNLNRFYPENQEEADNSFGDILRLKTRENFIRMFQRYKVGMIPIYRSIIVDNAQSSQVALSEKLLNKPNYYSGEYGIDKYGSSLVSTDYGDYFTDTINRTIIRVSLDGVTNISDTFNLADWANSNINIDTYGYGCFNYENRNVIMLIGSVDPDTNVITNNIVAYSESDKKFESFYGFTKAQAMLFINGLIYTLYVDPTFQVNQGWHLYRHDSLTRNNFYGQQQSSTVSTVFNGNFQLKKTYTAIEELANGLWTVNMSTGPLTNQITNLVAADFQKPVGNTTFDSKENKFNATIKRDTTSPGGKYLGTQMKGLYAQVQLNNAFTTPQRLISVSLKYIQSPLTNM